MANYLSPFSARQFLDANGDPYSGAKLFTYVSGSSTKVTTYKDEAGSTAHANPIVLNTKGEPADGSGVTYPIWQIGGAAVKYVLAPSTDTDPPASPIATWDNIDGINDASVSIDQWVSGTTPTYVSTTSFTVVGDLTSTYHVGRRIKTINSGGTIYSTISATAYTTLTTVTVTNDSGTLDSGLSAVYYALVTATGTSVPGVQVSGSNWTHIGQVTMSGKSLWTAEGAAVASVADCNIWTTDGNTVHITGTTTISDWGTAPQAGAFKFIIFDDALTLTHNASTNNLPGAVDITTAANDTAMVYAESTTAYRVMFYTRYSGLPDVIGGSNIQTFTASGTWTKPAGYASTSKVYIQAWGGGGSGGSGLSATLTGGGGGGGAYNELWKTLSELGATETVTIGAGGTAVTFTSDGVAGGTTTVGTLITAYGGGGGGSYGGVGDGGGGGGGAGLGGAGGSVAASLTGGTAGVGVAGWGTGGTGGDGSNGANNPTAGQAGATNYPWGGGGGGGSDDDSQNTTGTGGAALWGGGGGGGGGGVTSGAAGGTSTYGGNGGAGAVDTATATSGSQPGGGGGGAENGTSGAGGAGKVIITVFA